MVAVLSCNGKAFLKKYMFLQQQLCRIVCLVAQHRAALANRRVCECCRGSAEVKRTNSREVRCLDCWLSRDLRYLQQPWQESCSNDPRRPNHSWHYHFLLQLRGRGRMGGWHEAAAGRQRRRRRFLTPGSMTSSGSSGWNTGTHIRDLWVMVTGNASLHHSTKNSNSGINRKMLSEMLQIFLIFKTILWFWFGTN